MILTVTVAWGQSIVGRWKAINDEDNSEESIVEFAESDGEFYGKIVKLFPKPGEDPNPTCHDCSEDDPRFGKSVIGMIVLEGLKKRDRNKWEDGEFLDWRNGAVYSCYLELVDKDKLKLRAFIGFSLLGRTQYWKRVK